MEPDPDPGDARPHKRRFAARATAVLRILRPLPKMVPLLGTTAEACIETVLEIAKLCEDLAATQEACHDMEDRATQLADWLQSVKEAVDDGSEEDGPPHALLAYRQLQTSLTSIRARMKHIAGWSRKKQMSKQTAIKRELDKCAREFDDAYRLFSTALSVQLLQALNRRRTREDRQPSISALSDDLSDSSSSHEVVHPVVPFEGDIDNTSGAPPDTSASCHALDSTSRENPEYHILAKTEEYSMEYRGKHSPYVLLNPDIGVFIIVPPKAARLAKVVVVILFSVFD